MNTETNTEMNTQKQRLAYLVEAFKEDSGQYQNLDTPDDAEGRRRILRSLMNIRMPKEMPEQVLKVQDDYLKERATEKGIVTVEAILTVRESFALIVGVDRSTVSIWEAEINEHHPSREAYNIIKEMAKEKGVDVS